LQSAISEGLRHVEEVIRTTSIAPGAVESELKLKSHKESADFVKEFYQSAIPADAIARTAFAIEQPANVDVNQIVLRPTGTRLLI
jgi:NADP-dependent 3-hydroxy acid dehydrogenase YdfG